jgi:hypothetical protein
VIDSVRPYFSMIHVLPCVALRGICQLTSGGVRGRQSAIGRDEEEQSKGRCSSSAGRCSRFAEAFQTADLSARKCLDELGVIRQAAPGRLNSSSRKINDSYGRPVACRRPISQVRFAEM